MSRVVVDSDGTAPMRRTLEIARARSGLESKAEATIRSAMTLHNSLVVVDVVFAKTSSPGLNLGVWSELFLFCHRISFPPVFKDPPSFRMACHLYQK